jgi:ADP-ribosylglycohydrolase
MGNDKIRGCLLGVAIGDALGAPFEGKDPGSVCRKVKSNDGRIKDFYPFFGGIGTWTDDTGMTLAVCRALIKHEGTRKPMETCFREAFYDWINSDESRGSGRTVTYAAKHGVADLNSWSSGGLMRTSPVSIYAYQKGYTIHQAADLAYWVASLSHGHPQATFPAVECTLALLSIFRYNRDIAVYCEMGNSIYDIIKKMNKHRLVYPEDYFVFDASGHLGIPWIKDHQPVDFQVGWLRGFTREAGTMVSYADGPQEETALLPDPGARHERLRARVIF